MAKQTSPPRYTNPVGSSPISLAQVISFVVGFLTVYFLQIGHLLNPLDPALIRIVIPDLPRFSDFYIDHGWFYGYPVVGGFVVTVIWTILVEFRNWRYTIAP